MSVTITRRHAQKLAAQAVTRSELAHDAPEVVAFLGVFEHIDAVARGICRTVEEGREIVCPVRAAGYLAGEFWTEDESALVWAWDDVTRDHLNLGPDGYNTVLYINTLT